MAHADRWDDVSQTCPTCCGSDSSVLSCCFLGAQCAMLKGWSKAPVLVGWVQIVRGPRPLSETSGRPPPGKPKSHSPQVPVRQPNRLPEQVVADAAESTGGENNVHAKPLVEALKAARAKSRVPPVSERLTSCRNFLERARKRVTRAEDLITKTMEQKTVFMQEVAKAEERSAIGGGRVEANATIGAECDGVAAENRGVGPRTRRIAYGGNVVCRRPPRHPNAKCDLQELQGWLSESLETQPPCQIGRVGRSGHLHDGFYCSNNVVGRRVQINSDVGSDRFGIGLGAQFPSVVGNHV